MTLCELCKSFNCKEDSCKGCIADMKDEYSCACSKNISRYANKHNLKLNKLKPSEIKLEECKYFRERNDIKH